MKRLLFLVLTILIFNSCQKDESVNFVQVNFILVNDLLWNIGHDYYVSGVDENGTAFSGQEEYITYMNYLLESQKIKKGSQLTLYRDSSVLWTTDPIDGSCSIKYCDSAFDDWYEIE